MVVNSIRIVVRWGLANTVYIYLRYQKSQMDAIMPSSYEKAEINSENEIEN